MNNNLQSFESCLADSENRKSYYFSNPVDSLVLNNSDIKKFFLDLENASKKYWLAGFLSYELGTLLEEKTKKEKYQDKFPFAFFYLYEKPEVLEHESVIKSSMRSVGDYRISNKRLDLSEKEYTDCIRDIREHIASGNIFQMNFTLKYNFDFAGDIEQLYCDLKKRQTSSYTAMFSTDEFTIISLSPELFFRKQGRKISVKPMKGTSPRSSDKKSDSRNFDFLKTDLKNRSENLMIVDLLRNDLSKISLPGNVSVNNLFEIEKYETVYQMTSTITSNLKEGVTYYDIIKSIFPSGSVTGAPKIKSMELINKYERKPRKVYTGALGFISPENEAVFNVPIRTVLIDNKGKGELGIGSGIVYDSDPNEEFNECVLKKSFFDIEEKENFEIIETIRYFNGYKDLDCHLKRMEKTAKEFNFIYKKNEVRTALKEYSENNSIENAKVRVLLGMSGSVTINHETIDSSYENEIEIGISNSHTNSKNIFLYHKTTKRKQYNEAFENARKNGVFDIVFKNEKNELTEGSISNIYLSINGNIYTPHLSSGLLPGIIREKLIKEKKVIEKVIEFEEIYKAEKIFISNSIIGFKEANLKTIK